MSLDQHAQAFMAYIAGLLADFDRYLATKPTDPVGDGADYRVAAMWLTDSELRDYFRDLRTVIQPRLANAPSRGRRRRMLYYVSLPAPDQSTAGYRQKRKRREGRR
jgi:hypothetical protein